MGDAFDEAEDRGLREMEDRCGPEPDDVCDLDPGDGSTFESLRACDYCGRGGLRWQAYEWDGQERWRLAERSGRPHQCMAAWEAREREALRRLQWPTSRR
jgi:hypothetical protein